MADAAEAAVAGSDLRLQHRFRAVAQQQIDVADDTGADQGLAIAAACAHRRSTVGEFDFADRAECLWALRAIRRTGLDIDGCYNVVARPDIRGQVLDHVAQTAAIPEMMVRIDD